MKAPYDLHHDAWGQLVLIDAEGEQFDGIELVRIYPITDPDHWIAICDPQGHELSCIEDPQTLPPRVRQVLDEHLAEREFLPVIRRIVRLSADVDPCEWHVETDRGRTRFLVNSEEDVRRLGANRTVAVDSHGIRYLIPDTHALDATSRRILDRYL
jgi:hypothetical protein